MPVCPAEDDEHEADRAHNLNLLATMCTEVSARLRHTECTRRRPGCHSPRHAWMLSGCTSKTAAQCTTPNGRCQPAARYLNALLPCPAPAACLQLDHTERELSAPVDLLGVFRAHEVGATTTFAGALQITKNVAIQVGGGSLPTVLACSWSGRVFRFGILLTATAVLGGREYAPQAVCFEQCCCCRAMACQPVKMRCKAGAAGAVSSAAASCWLPSTQ